MKSFLSAVFSVAILSTAQAWAGPSVLATLHPLGLVAASVTPVEDLQVLLPAGVTPHDFSLRPSDIGKLQKADVIFWGGEEAEPYLASFVQRWPDKAWVDVSAFADEDEHGHSDEHHAHEDVHHDPHWWLSPDTMIEAQAALADKLDADAAPFATELQAQIQRSQQQLQPLQEQGFFVFHRAYDHWVELMGLNQVGAFTLSPEQKPGMKTLQAMRQQLALGNVVCVFSEPEFSPALVDSTVRGLDVKRGELDPMAANITLSVDGYARYLQDLTDRFSACLSD